MTLCQPLCYALHRRKTGPEIFILRSPVLPAGAGNSPADPTNMGASQSRISEFGTVYGNFFLKFFSAADPFAG